MMDGKRIRQYWSNEMLALLDIYKQFEIMIPSEKGAGSAHKGEDGRYVETLLKEYLKRFLPTELEVLTGFILRPAVKTGSNGKYRRKEQDAHSSQLDIIIFNSSQYPVFQRFGDSVIVPPEGVVGIISVKKHLHEQDIILETTALKKAAKLCRCLDCDGRNIRGPFLGLVSMSSFEKKSIPTEKWIFEKLQEVYSDENVCFDDLICYIGSLSEWSIFKERSRGTRNTGKYLYFRHDKEENHMGFQFILSNILSVYYDASRNNIARPGFTSFESNRQCDRLLGLIEAKKLR